MCAAAAAREGGPEVPKEMDGLGIAVNVMVLVCVRDGVLSYHSSRASSRRPTGCAMLVEPRRDDLRALI
jgi:hypothetical protein